MNLCRKLEKLFSCLLGAAFGIIVLYLTILSMFSTSAIDVNEHTYYLTDHPVPHLIVIAVAVIALVFLRKKFPTVTLPAPLLKILFAAILILEAVWILSTQLAPYADQNLVLSAAKELRNHDYSSFQQGGYGYLYHHQHGIILFYYFLSFLFGRYNYVAMQFINILALAAIFFCIPKISLLLFKKKLAAQFTYLGLVLYFPLSLYVTFVYGNIIGLALAMAGIVWELYYFESQKPVHALLSALLICLAIILKQNYLIVLLAMLILGVLHTIYHRRPKALLLLFALVSCYLLSSLALDKAVIHVTGKPVVKGVPMTAYLAMGLQEAAMAPGWYNDYNRTLFVKEDYDTKATSELALQNIKDSVHKFLSDPNYSYQFFAKKTASEWNNPSFQCFWIHENRTTKIPLSPFIQRLIHGDSNSRLSSYFNLIHTLILFGTLSYIVLDFKNLRFDGLLFALIFLGGFLFHFLWEAKSQYTLPYFILLIPYAVNGFLLLSDQFIGITLKTAQKPAKMLAQHKLLCLSLLVFFILIRICTVSNHPLITSAIRLNGDDVNYQTYLNMYP